MKRLDQDEMGCMDGVYGMGLHGMDGDKLNRNTRIRGVTVRSSTKNNTQRNGLTRTKWDVRMAVYGMGRNGMDGQQTQSYNWIHGDAASSPTKAIPTKTASSNKRSCMTAHWVVCTFAKNPSDLGSAACAVSTAIANFRRLRTDPRSTKTVPSQWKGMHSVLYSPWLA